MSAPSTQPPELVLPAPGAQTQSLPVPVNEAPPAAVIQTVSNAVQPAVGEQSISLAAQQSSSPLSKVSSLPEQGATPADQENQASPSESKLQDLNFLLAYGLASHACHDEG